MYNIPVALWILDTHPIHAPLCYVRPTPDMQIKVSQHVDGNGKIYLPYLHEWDAANSDILGLVQMCIITFGEQPPPSIWTIILTMALHRSCTKLMREKKNIFYVVKRSGKS